MLNAIGSETLRRAIGNQCLAAAGFAIHGGNAENVLTANAVTLTIDGVFNAFAAQTEIDLSAITVHDRDGVVDDTKRTLADGYEQKFVLAANAADTIVVVAGDPLPTAQGDEPDWPSLPDGYAPFGGLKVVNASSADFVLGTTDLSASGITDTYYDIMTIPPRAT